MSLRLGHSVDGPVPTVSFHTTSFLFEVGALWSEIEPLRGLIQDEAAVSEYWRISSGY